MDRMKIELSGSTFQAVRQIYGALDKPDGFGMEHAVVFALVLVSQAVGKHIYIVDEETGLINHYYPWSRL